MAKMARWIKMPFGRKVGLEPSDIVLDGYTQLPFPKGDRALDFRPCLLWLNGCMDEDATWYGNRPQPRPHCVRRGPSCCPRPRKGHSSPTLFAAHVCCGHGRPSQLLLSSCLSLISSSLPLMFIQLCLRQCCRLLPRN